tara:strand:- start:14581 stop:14898 length:318 start_codon:yes stop_codon:yes gene_type:complete
LARSLCSSQLTANKEHAELVFAASAKGSNAFFDQPHHGAYHIHNVGELSAFLIKALPSGNFPENVSNPIEPLRSPRCPDNLIPIKFLGVKREIRIIPTQTMPKIL